MIDFPQLTDMRDKQQSIERSQGALLALLHYSTADCVSGCEPDNETMATMLELAVKNHRESVDIRVELELLHRGIDGDVRLPTR